MTRTKEAPSTPDRWPPDMRVEVVQVPRWWAPAALTVAALVLAGSVATAWAAWRCVGLMESIGGILQAR